MNEHGFHSKLAALSQDAYFFKGLGMPIRGENTVPHLEESTRLQKYKTTKKECNKSFGNTSKTVSFKKKDIVNENAKIEIINLTLKLSKGRGRNQLNM